MTLDSGQGALFPNPTGGDIFYATLVDASNNKEIIRVTARVSNTLTIVRAQDGTTARSFIAGARVGLRFIAAIHNLYAQKAADNAFSVAQSFITGTNVRGAAAGERLFSWNTVGEKRFAWVLDDAAEAGANVGSDYLLRAYDDDGVSLGTVMKVKRSTRVVTDKSANVYDAFPAGTALLFYQASAPTGWTAAAQNDKALRVVNQAGGLGGSAAGTTAFSTVMAARTILTTNLPAHGHASGTLVNVADTGHNHGVSGGTLGATGAGAPNGTSSPGAFSGLTAISISTGGAHNHVISGNTADTGGGTAMDFAIQYCNVIICTKDA